MPPKPKKEGAPKAPIKKDPRPFFSTAFPSALLESKGIKGPTDISKVPQGVRRYYGVSASGQLQIQIVDFATDARYTCLVFSTGLTIYVQESGLDQLATTTPKEKPATKPAAKPAKAAPAAKPKSKPKPEPEPEPEDEDDADTGDFDDDGSSFEDEPAEDEPAEDDGSDEETEDDGSDEGAGDEDSWEDDV